ncbi:MAG TPA: P1 family peptidase [Candidatus Dormibacteraeota bacterium]|nr:P1 family peptidase [Candidatus Dormibacteraeota bacterium]
MKRARAREAGVPLRGVPRALNAITDVAGVEVGMTTLIEGQSVRTGVTAIHPRGRAGLADAIAAGFHSMNGNGEMTGVSWIRESGTLSGPICITNTHAIGVAHQGVIRWAHRRDPEGDAWLLPVVAETWDGYLNDAWAESLKVEHVVDALESAAGGPVAEGSVGGGTGMNCYHFKGGTGTSSRVVGDHVVGVLVQANFGARRELTIAGVPVGLELPDDDPMAEAELKLKRPLPTLPAGGEGTSRSSIIGIALTDVPLTGHQCEALARRMPLGVGRTGTSVSHFSGDLFLAASVAREKTPLPWDQVDPLFEAVVQATEEAILNALFVNEEMTGRDGHRSPALPVGRVISLLERRALFDKR